MKLTKWFNFKKPDPLDTVNINDINDSFDLIDEKLKETEDTNKSLIQQFKNLIINAGNSNAEVAASRGNYDYLPKRLDSFDEQFNTITNDIDSNISTIQNNKYNLTFNKNQLGVNIQNPMSLDVLKSKFDLMKDIGIHNIVLCPQGNLSTYTSNILNESVINYEEIEQYTIECLNSGFNVIYKLHIECDDGKWRAEIEPSDIDTFFSNYKAFIIKYAKLAQKYNLPVFCVGEEMMSISTTTYKTYWEDIFNSLKQVYKGKTTYGANLIVWDDEHRRNCIYDYVDYLGIDLWAKQCDIGGDNSSNYLNLNGWIIPTFEELYQKYGKKIILTEIGYFPTPEGATTGSSSSQSWGKLDYNYQARYYNMMFSNFLGQDWLEDIWYWAEKNTSYSNPNGGLDRFSVLIDDNIVTQNVFRKYKEV